VLSALTAPARRSVGQQLAHETIAVALVLLLCIRRDAPPPTRTGACSAGRESA